MNDSAVTVAVAGIGAFSAFLPDFTAVGANPAKERIGLLYASGATLAIGYLMSRDGGSQTPMFLALIVIGFEWIGYEHARRTVQFPPNQ